MISGIVMILAVIWVYQSLIKARQSNLLLWTAGCALAFFATVTLADIFCIEILDGLNGKDIGGEYDPSLADARDRKTQEGTGGTFMPVVCELFPSVLALLAVAVIRTMFITKEALTPANLFSGLGEMFSSIKNSFKPSDN